MIGTEGNENGDNITVILTLYKRPDMLLEQLEAIENQTIKPDKIMLFQDKLPNAYQIDLGDDLIQRFDHVEIANSNQGVWGRFRYATTVKDGYVCIFDDDTIPGRRWLENCYNHAKKMDGIYGTIGIVLTDKEGYPLKNFFRVGWSAPNETCEEVDFVGHSWFFRRKILDYLFEGTEKYQELKYVAEDMCLSALAQRHGVRTFVPPHPDRDFELYGSNPATAQIVGTRGVGVSANKHNLGLMDRAVVALQGEGWEPLFTKDEQSVEKRYAKYVKLCRKRWLNGLVDYAMRKNR